MPSPSATESTPLTSGLSCQNNDGQPERLHQNHLLSNVIEILQAYSFLFLIAAAISLAYVYPPFGAIYLCPAITANWISVLFIFLMAGLSMKSEELRKACVSLPFNAFVQIYNFAVVSMLVFGFIRLVDAFGVPIQKDLADAMMICACMPITVTMVIVMTKSADGDGAAAIFNAAFGSLLGVFVSPALIIRYTGLHGSVDLMAVFVKLSLKVILPIAVGQVLHFSDTASKFVHKQKKHFRRLQEYTLVFIVYTVFCKTFLNASASNSVASSISIIDVLYMAFSQLALLSLSMVGAWACLKALFGDDIRRCIMGLYGCTQKSVLMGIPLINALFDSPNAGLYTLPLLVWHPLQLIIGSALAPRLAKMAEMSDTDGEDFSLSTSMRSSAREDELMTSQRALRSSTLVAWESTIDMKELLEES